MRKKLIIISIFGASVSLLLLFFTFIFQSIWMISWLFESPETVANINNPSNNKNADVKIERTVDDIQNQTFLVEKENDKNNQIKLSNYNNQNDDSQVTNDTDGVFQNDNILDSEYDISDLSEDGIDLQINQAMFLQQLEELLANRNDFSRLVNTLNQLAMIGNSDALSALIDGYQKTKYDGYSTVDILNAISKVNNPEVVYDLDTYMNNAFDDGDSVLLVSVATALSNIGNEEATDMLINTLSMTPEEDEAYAIISKAVANIRNTDVAPILVNMIEEKANGYESAIEALLKLGDFGTEKITKFLTQDENIEYREKLLSVTETMQFDEETYYTLNKLAELNEEYEDFFRNAGNNLTIKNHNGGYRVIE